MFDQQDEMTPSQAKNSIAKALLELIEPRPNTAQKRKIRVFFENKCAYCGCDIPPEGRTGHMDHLIPRHSGGTNHISNLVLACNICNGDEKLDQDWQAYIHKKVRNPTERQERIARIERWIADQGGPVAIPPEARAEVEKARLQIIAAFDEATKDLRQKRSNQRFYCTVLPGGKTAAVKRSVMSKD